MLSREQVLEIVRRLAKGVPLDVLRSRLQPTSKADRPIPPAVPRPSDWSAAAREQRVELVEKSLGVPIPHLAGREPLPDPATLKPYVDQYLGMTQVPTGLIGPLRVNGFHAHGDYYIPLATTEASLVAGYHRGARLATRAGGINALTTAEQVQRAPGFVFAGIAEASQFGAWAVTRFEAFREIASERSGEVRLLDMQTHLEANYVYLIFDYFTGDSAGQHYATTCTEAILTEILATTPFKPRHAFLESNMSGEKKANVLSFLRTRGRNVMAEVTLPARLVRRVLRCEPQRVCDYWRMSFVGGVQTGSVGVSGHISDGLCALYLACGQEVSSVSEATVGITRFELTDAGDLYCGLTLPNLVVGTVDGGTGLPTAQECLRILRCDGTGKAQKFAEISAAVALAGEISLAGVLASQFAGGTGRAAEKPVEIR